MKWNIYCSALLLFLTLDFKGYSQNTIFKSSRNELYNVKDGNLKLLYTNNQQTKFLFKKDSTVTITYSNGKQTKSIMSKTKTTKEGAFFAFLNDSTTITIGGDIIVVTDKNNSKATMYYLKKE